MKKLLFSLLLAMAGIIVAHADELKVAGISVDLTSSGAVTGSGISGSVFYDAGEKRLTLTNATITTQGIGISANVSPGSLAFRVYLIGKNTINSERVSVRADRNILFCGNGELELNGPGNLINQCKMTVYACRLTVNSTGNDAFHSMPTGNADLELAYHGALKASCKEHVLANFNAITYTTGTLLSGDPSEPEMVIGDDYKLEIAGVKVTPFNRDAVTGQGITGTVSVSLVNQNAGGYSGLKVNLKDARINSGTYGIYFKDETRDITLALTGDNAISAYSSRGLTGHTGWNCGAFNIEGIDQGSLTITAATGITHMGDLNVKNCRIDIKGSSNGIHLWDYGTLTVDNATIHASASSSEGAAVANILGVKYLNGCTETEPLKASYNSSLKGIADSNSEGATLLKDVTIEPTYGVVVCGQILKKSMGSSTFNVTGNGITGTVTYSPAENVLTLADGAELGFCGGKNWPATIEVLDCSAGIDDENSFFTIKSMGTEHNKICDRSGSSGYAIFSYNDVRISGSAPLDIEAGYGVKTLNGHGMLIDLMADFTDEAKFNNAFYSNSINLPLSFAPDRSASYTYRFKSWSHNTFNFLSSLNMGSFSILSPKGATYDSKKQNVVVDGSPVGPGQWVVFGNPQYANGYGLRIADNDPFLKNQKRYPYVMGGTNTWCLQFYNTWYTELHDVCHIHSQKENAVVNYYTHLLPWNGEVDLDEVISLHGNENNERDVPIDWKEKGYRWKFELENYDIHDYQPEMESYPDNSLFAWLDGNVLKACYAVNGEQQRDKQYRNSIGREPLVKVTLLDKDGSVLEEGYIKFRIGTKQSDMDIKMNMADANATRTADGTEYKFSLRMIDERIIRELPGEPVSKAEIENNYCFDVDMFAPDEEFEQSFGRYDSPDITSIQPFVKYRGQWVWPTIQSTLTDLKDTSRLGSFKWRHDNIDELTLYWTITDSEAEKLKYERVAVRLYDPWFSYYYDFYLVFSAKEAPKGDTNFDGVVDVADIATIVDAMARGLYNDSDYDVNGDGVVDVADIAAVTNIMAGHGG